MRNREFFFKKEKEKESHWEGCNNWTRTRWGN